MSSTRRHDGSRLAGARILVVEDDTDIRRMIATVLCAAGATVDEASTVPEAERAARAACPDCLVLDWNLADAPAAEALRRIEQACPGLAQHTAVVTGDLTHRGEPHAAEAQGLAVLRKPFRPRELVALVARIAAR